MSSKEINIIGAGFAGLSAASALAKNGFKVRIFEKNDLPGGRARKYEENGFHFDLGPSWYWMPEVFESFFNQYNSSVSDHYNLKKLDPGYRMFFGKNDHIDVPGDLDELYSLFEKIEKGAGSKLRKFLQRAEYKYKIGINELVYLPGSSYLELVRWDLIKGILKLDFFNNVSAYVKREFKDKRLRQILEFPVIFLGATPQNTPALYTLMNYADLVLGTWYPMGGMYKIVEAMVKTAESLGVEINLNSNVEEILIKNRKISGIRINDNVIPSDILVSAADYHHVEQELLPEAYRRYSENYWDKRVMAPSSLLFYLGINKKLKGLQHHNLFFDEDFTKHAEQIYDNPKWPDQPALYVSCTSVTDPVVAPEGHENLTILIPVAPNLEDNEKIREDYFDLVINRLESITGQDIRDHIVYKRSYAHRDFMKDYNSYKGNAYGLANTLWQTANLKPRMRSPKLPNLFYTGQLTVPGPGVPPTIISGQVVAKEIIKSLKMNGS